jgi:hypothetical protein
VQGVDGLRWFGAVVAGVLAVALVGGCDSLPEAAPQAVAGAAACPASYPPPPEATRRGALVPDGATEALLCVYDFNGGQLARTLPAPVERLADLTGYLNSLRPHDPSTALSCAAIGHDMYEVVLGYPGDTHVAVWVDYPCGVGASTGAFVRFDALDRLLGFWPEANPG